MTTTFMITAEAFAMADEGPSAGTTSKGTPAKLSKDGSKKSPKPDNSWDRLKALNSGGKKSHKKKADESDVGLSSKKEKKPQADKAKEPERADKNKEKSKSDKQSAKTQKNQKREADAKRHAAKKEADAKRDATKKEAGKKEIKISGREIFKKLSPELQARMSASNFVDEKKLAQVKEIKGSELEEFGLKVFEVGKLELADRVALANAIMELGVEKGLDPILFGKDSAPATAKTPANS